MELIERHFDIALKSPDGIKKLRELILSLAMQGKLVAQDANDQPASELLKEIEAEKKKLIKAGKMKPQEPLPPIKSEEITFEVPTGWEWVRLGEIGSTNIGLTYSPKDIADIGIPVLRSNNVQKGKIDLNNLVRVNKKVDDKVHVQQGDILICARNGSKALVGKAAQIKELPERMAFGAFMAIFRSRCNDFIEEFLNSPIFRKALDDVSTTTINQITQSNLKNSIVPLPPIAEQKRIVAKIDQLMTLCDKLEAERDARNKKRVTLHTAAMDRLLSAPDEAAFSASWEFITRNFCDLYSVSENVAELKKAILQLSVMGKLVPQDANDQPASELLKEIEAEKKRLIKEGKIKKQEPLPPIKPEEIPYEVPEGWEWVRIQDVGFILGGKRIPKGYDYSKTPTPYRYLTVTNMKNGTIVDNNVKFIDEATRNIIKQYVIYKENIYITIAGTIGVVGSIPDKYDGMNLTENASRLVFFGMDKKYLINSIHSFSVQSQFATLTNKMAQPKLSLRSILGTYISIPPLAEQKRIVAKVDQLMELCNSLEQQLQDSTRTQTAILDAVLATM